MKKWYAEEYEFVGRFENPDDCGRGCGDYRADGSGFECDV